MDATRVRALGALVLCVACGETSPPYTPVDTAGGAAPFVEQINGSPAPPDTPNQTTSLELPNLTHIDDQLYIYLGWNLAEVDLRSLQAVGSRVFIHRNIDLKTLRLDSLTDSPQLEITGNLSLPSCITESLARFGGSAANGDADTRCHCEMVCDHLKGVCEDVKTP